MTSLPTTSPSTHRPTAIPSISFSPTTSPSHHPTISDQPSAQPTTLEPIVVTETYSQTFIRGDNAEFVNKQKTDFETLYQEYTSEYANTERVTTKCEILRQTLESVIVNTTESNLFGDERRYLQTQTKEFHLTVIYQMKYETVYNDVDISNYPMKFIEFINNTTETIKDDLSSQGLIVTRVREVMKGFAEEPSVSPSYKPTLVSIPEPSTSPSTSPSKIPTSFPSLIPTNIISTVPSNFPSHLPSLTPSQNPSFQPSLMPSQGPKLDKRTLIIIIAGSVVVGLGLILIICAVCLRPRRSTQICCCCSRKNVGHVNETDIEAGPVPFPYEIESGLSSESMDSNVSVPQQIIDNAGPILGSDSVDSNGSLISAGMSNHSGDSSEVLQSKSGLKEEFDTMKYEMINRAKPIQSHNYDAASTRDVLLDKYDFLANGTDDYTWDGSKDAFEIEATALYKTNEWKKRQHGASESEK